MGAVLFFASCPAIISIVALVMELGGRMTSSEIERLHGELVMAHNAVRIALIRMEAYRRERDEALSALRDLQQRVEASDVAAADPGTGGRHQGCVCDGTVADNDYDAPRCGLCAASEWETFKNPVYER